MQNTLPRMGGRRVSVFCQEHTDGSVQILDQPFACFISNRLQIIACAACKNIKEKYFMACCIGGFQYRDIGAGAVKQHNTRIFIGNFSHGNINHTPVFQHRNKHSGFVLQMAKSCGKSLFLVDNDAIASHI